MRTTVLLAILLLTLGLFSAPAMAGENAVIQQSAALYQPISNADLSQMNGKLMAQPDLLQVAERLIVSKIPPSTQKELQEVCTAVRLLTGGGMTKQMVTTQK